MCHRLTFGYAATIFCMVSIASFSAPTNAGNQERQSSEAREAMQAYEITLHALGMVVSTTRKPLTDEVYNLAMDAGYLGITFLQRSRSKDASKFLAYLNLVNLDGELAETHTCAVLSRGPEISQYLEKAREAAKAKKCVLEGVDAKSVPGLCASAEDATRRISSQIEALRSHRICQ